MAGDPRIDRLAGKVGPRLAAIISEAMATQHRNLADHKVAVGVHTAAEFGGLLASELSPHLAAILREAAARPEADQHLASLAEFLARGQGQAAGLVDSIGVGASLGPGIGAVFSNFLAPAIWGLLWADPNSVIDPNLAATMVARDLWDADHAETEARIQGFSPRRFHRMVAASTNYGDPATILAGFHRGEIDPGRASEMLRHAGYSNPAIDLMLSTSQLLLDPATAAALVARNLLGDNHGENIAAASGMHAGDFAQLVQGATHYGDPATLIELRRRGIISHDHLVEGFRRAGISQGLADDMPALTRTHLLPAQAADMVIKGIISDHDGREIAAVSGMHPGDFDNLVLDTGEPPAIEELLLLFRRGVIGHGRLVHGIRQSHIRDEWIDEVVNLKYGPPPGVAAIDAAVQHHLSHDEARNLLAESGIDPDNFDWLYKTHGRPLGLDQVLLLYRRGQVDKAFVEQSIRESDIKNKYVDNAIDLRYGPPPGASAVAAAVQNQISEHKARKLLGESGIDPEHFDWLYRTHGRPLGLHEMLSLFNRGKVEKGDVEQAIRESDIKNKYIDAALDLHRYIPPPRSIPALLSTSSITPAEAAQLFKDNGLSDKLAAAYVHSATAEKIARPRQVAASVIETLYHDQAIGRAEAVDMLADLGYSHHESAFMLEVVDLQREQKYLEAAISRVHAQYVNHRLSKAAALSALHTLEVPTEQANGLVKLWGHEQAANVRTLTAAQIADAYEYDIVAGDLARKMLEGIGYSPFDAWLTLSIKDKKPLPNRPPMPHDEP